LNNEKLQAWNFVFSIQEKTQIIIRIMIKVRTLMN
jgi:hypothetical protein